MLVVLGHCPDVWGLGRWIYAFHMPLFAFIGGLFLKQEPLKTFAAKKATRLLLPFFVWSFFFWVLYDLIVYFRDPQLFSDQLRHIVFILGGSGQNAIQGYANATLWFLPFLFSSSMIYFCCTLSFKRTWVQIVIMIFIASAGLLCSRFNIKLPYKLNTAFTLYPFLWAGTRFFRCYRFFSDNNWRRKSFVMLACAGIYVLAVLNNTNVDTASNVVGNFILFYSGAFAAIVFFCLLCQMIESIGFVDYLGRNSIVLLIFNAPIIQMVGFLNRAYCSPVISMLCPFLVVILSVPLISVLNRYFPLLIGKSGGGGK